MDFECPIMNPLRLDANGRIFTDDEELNRIIRAVEEDRGSPLRISSVIPAVTFGEDPDSKVYLLLLTMLNDCEDSNSYTYKEWMVKIGRQATYDYLKDLIKNEAIDPTESFIISGTSDHDITLGKDNVTFDSKAITVFRFMKVMNESHKVLDDEEAIDFNDYDPHLEYSGTDKTIFEI